MKVLTPEVLPAFYAPVEKVSSASLIPGMSFLSYNNTAIVIDSPETGKTTVNFCSEGYGLVPCSDIFPELEELLDADFENVEVSYRVAQQAKFYADYYLQGNEVKVGKEILSPTLHIQHSYNSRIVFQVLLGYFYQPTQTVLYGPGSAIVLSHVDGNVEEMVTDTLEAAKTFPDQKKSVTAIFKKMAGKPIRNYTERVNQIIEKTGFHKVSETICALINERFAQPTDFDIYTMFNYYLSFDSVQMQEEAKIKLEKKVFMFLLGNEAILD